MNRGKDCEGGGRGGGGRGESERHVAPPIQVPIGWQRKVDHCGVAYISPSGSLLSCLDQVRAYLLTDGTCKCGLECPLILPKVFNFDPGAAVKLRTPEDVRADEDVTRLCIHKRKLLAVATLHQSMETHPALTLSATAGGASSVAASHPSSQRAIRSKNKSHPNLPLPDCKNPFKMMMAAAGQQHRHYNHHQYSQDPGAVPLPQQQELYPGYLRPQQRLGTAEHDPRLPYRSGYGGMLSPPPPPSSSSSGGLGPHSPVPDPLCSPDAGYQRGNSFPGFSGALSPSLGSLNGAHRHPLSPPAAGLHGPQPPQSSCAMAGRASTPLSPTAKAPLVNMARGGHFPPGAGMEVPRVPFPHHHHPHHHHHRPPPPPSPCALSKKQLALEKDPLGILDPIPAKPKSHPASSSSAHPALSGFHTQVPAMNVNAPPPPTVVPLPSNLPLPSVKPGPAAHGPHHGHRTPQAPSPSVPPSPVTSPAHASSLAPGRPDASPHRSRSSSTSSEHGGFAMPTGGVKAPPRSPRSAMGSPRPAVPSSPSVKPDPHLHHPSQQHAATPSPLYPAPASSLPPQKSHPAGASTGGGGGGGGGPPPGLLGMPLNHILNQQNAASFPASSLLSAAAKAQLANQNKHGSASNSSGSAAGAGGGGGGGGGSGMGPGAGGGGGSAHPGGPPAGHSHMLPPSSSPGALLSTPGEAQSGRAALRDKLMAQQRDPLHKRKTAAAAVSHNNNGSVAGNLLNHHHPQPPQLPQDGGGMVFSLLKQPGGGGGLQQPGGGPRMPALSPAEQLRKVARLSGGGGLPSNASMASQLLQSMSGQSAHHAGGAGHLRPGSSPGSGPMHYGDGSAQQSMLVQQRLRGPGPALVQNMDPGAHHPSGPPHPHPHFPDMMAQIQASSLGSCAGSMGGRGGGGSGDMSMGQLPSSNPPPLSHSGPHPHHLLPQPQGLLHGLAHGTSGMVVMGHRGNSLAQGLADQGIPSTLHCSMTNPQSHHSQGYPQQHHTQQQALHPGMQAMAGPLGPGYQNHSQQQQQQQNFNDGSFPETGSNSNSMSFLYQNYQMTSQPGMTSRHEPSHHPSHSQPPPPPQQQQQQQQHHPHFREAQRSEHHAQGEALPAGPPSGSDRLLCGGGGGGPEAVDAIYRAVVDAASKGKHVVITTAVSGASQASPVAALSAMSVFTNSIGESAGVNVPSVVSSVAVRGQRPHPDPDSLSQQQQQQQRARPRPNQNQGRPPGRPQGTPEPGKTTPEDPKQHGHHHDYFRAPARGVGRPQWEGDPAAFEGGGGGGGGGWGVGEEFLECSTHVRSSSYMERPGALAPAPPCPSDHPHHPLPHHQQQHPHHDPPHPHLHPQHQSAPLPSDKASYLEDGNGYRFSNACGRTPANYKERLEQTVERCVHVNGTSGGGGGLQFAVRGYGDVLGPPRQELTGDDQSPSSSTSLEGPLLKDYGHYNGHFNGCTPSPSDTKSLSSEEDLRHPDSPSSEMLQYRARGLNMGELVWGQLRGGFPAWPGGKLNGEDLHHHHHHNHHHHHHHHHNAGLQLGEHGKVEPEKLKTLSHDLETLDRVTKRNRKAGKLNNHLEAAIHEAMSELDKMSGSVHHQIPSRDRQAKLPKPKRRKISR